MSIALRQLTCLALLATIALLPACKKAQDAVVEAAVEKATGVSVPMPEDQESVTSALMQAVLLCLLAFAKLLPAAGALLLIVLGLFMYLQNSASQVLYMDVAAQAHPGSMNLAASLNSMSFNIGIALGSAVGGVVNDEFGLTWLGPFGAVFALLASLTVSGLHPTRAELGA